jgi:type IV pilus assembly protein PilM
VYTRVIDMPPLSEAELASALSWEAEQYIPVPLSEVNLDWQILGSKEMPDSESRALKRRKMAVLLVAAPKKLIDKVVGVVQLAGLEPVGLETDLLALTRAVVPQAMTGPILVCHLGAVGTEIGVIEGGQPAFVLAAATGGVALTRAIGAGLKLDFAQAEQYKRTYGLLDDQLEGKIKQVLLEPMTVIVNELKRAMGFYVAHAQAAVPMKQLVLSGGGAQLPGLGGYLAGQLNLETVVANPLAGVSWSSQVRNRWAGIESVFSVAAGLAEGGD